jgi:hypothetical protein
MYVSWESMGVLVEKTVCEIINKNIYCKKKTVDPPSSFSLLRPVRVNGNLPFHLLCDFL